MKCDKCNVDMIENAEITGQHPFELGMDGKSRILVAFNYGTREVKGLFGKVKEKDNYYEEEVKARVCPSCGKVELYIDIEK